MNPDLEAWASLGEPKARTVLSLWHGVMEVGPPEPPSRPTVAVIQMTVGAYFGVTKLGLISEQRARYIARPRQVAMWLCRQLTVRSMPDIGRRFGGRDHTTVLHAVRRIEALRVADPAIGKACSDLLAELGGQPA